MSEPAPIAPREIVAVVLAGGFGTRLARVLRGNAVAALENVALWHERDISHSSVERIIFPDSCTLLDYMLELPGNQDVLSINPLVAETNDGYLNDIRGRHVGRAVARAGQQCWDLCPS